MSDLKRYGIKMKPISQFPHFAEMKKGEMVKYTDYLLLEKKMRSMITTSFHNRTVNVWMKDCSRYQDENSQLRAKLAAAEEENERLKVELTRLSTFAVNIHDECLTCIHINNEPEKDFCYKCVATLKDYKKNPVLKIADNWANEKASEE